MENFTSEYFNGNVTEKLPGILGLNVTKVGRGSMELELEVERKHLAINGYLHAGTVVTHCYVLLNRILVILIMKLWYSLKPTKKIESVVIAYN